MRQSLPHQCLHRQGRVRGPVQAVQGPAQKRERCPRRISRHEELEAVIQTTPAPFQWLGRSKVRDLVFLMPLSCSKNITGLQQLQTSTNTPDTESKPEFRRRTTQSFLAIFERHAFYYIEETRGNVGYASGPYEKCDEKLSDMTAAINLVAILHLYSAIRLQCFLIL